MALGKVGGWVARRPWDVKVSYLCLYNSNNMCVIYPPLPLLLKTVLINKQSTAL